MRLVRSFCRLLGDLRADQSTDPHERGERSFWVLSLVLTFCAFLAAGAAFYESRQQAAFAQQQVNEMRDESRPWLKVTAAVGSDFVYKPIFGGWVKINVTLLNVGKTPAFNVRLSTLAVPETFFNGDEPLTVLDLCNKPPANFPFNALVLFPDDPATILQIVYVQDNPKLYYKGGGKPASGSAVIFIYGCAYYSYGDPPTLHHSGFIYLLGTPDPTGGTNPRPLPVYAPTLLTVRKADLELIQYQGEGALIN